MYLEEHSICFEKFVHGGGDIFIAKIKPLLPANRYIYNRCFFSDRGYGKVVLIKSGVIRVNLAAKEKPEYM